MSNINRLIDTPYLDYKEFFELYDKVKNDKNHLPHFTKSSFEPTQVHYLIYLYYGVNYQIPNQEMINEIYSSIDKNILESEEVLLQLLRTDREINTIDEEYRVLFSDTDDFSSLSLTEKLLVLLEDPVLVNIYLKDRNLMLLLKLYKEADDKRERLTDES